MPGAVDQLGTFAPRAASSLPANHIRGWELMVFIDSGLVGSTDSSGRGTTRAEDAQGTPTPSHTSPKYTSMRKLYGIIIGDHSTSEPHASFVSSRPPSGCRRHSSGTFAPRALSSPPVRVVHSGRSTCLAISGRVNESTRIPDGASTRSSSLVSSYSGVRVW